MPLIFEQQPKESAKAAVVSETLLTRAALARALNVSLRTVDQMIADHEITPIRLGGKLVRFYLPDVIAELRSRAQTSKHPITRSI
ncbi:MAG TPA: excisionase family DNA-binding protein [Candidatus Dormibacteraeota bacterium]|nr:excisionase family DNA-binding protein [Candidatus Dormibacteraeota bacterium]